MRSRRARASIAMVSLTLGAAGSSMAIVLPAGAAPGAQGNGSSGAPDVSAAGRYAVFTSVASNLVTGDTNGVADIFVRDTAYKKTKRISLGLNGKQANGASVDPSISDDGKFVVFTSVASNLVNGDTNNKADIFRVEVATGKTIRINVSSTGSQAVGASKRGRISGNGLRVVFISSAKNLVPGDTNNVQDIFQRDVSTNKTTRVSLSPSGAQLSVGSYWPSISQDGRTIGFMSDAFADPVVTAWCGRVPDTMAVISKLVAGASKPTITEAVCRSGSRNQVQEVRANNNGGVGYVNLVSDSGFGYADFVTRGKQGVTWTQSDADSYSVPSWDVGRYGDILAATTNASDYIDVVDLYGQRTHQYWPADNVAMSPDGSTVAVQTRDSVSQVWIWNWQTGGKTLVSTS